MKWPEVTLREALASAEVFVDGDWVESKDQDSEGDVRLIQLADVGDGEYINKSNRFLTSAKARKLKCTSLKQGDVLVARMPDPLGRACIFPGDPKPSVTVVDVCIIRPNGQGPAGRWLMHFLNSPTGRNQIAGFATGTTRSRISRSNLARIKVSLPPVLEQRRIAEILDKADALRAKRRAALAELETLTQSIFLEMFGDPVRDQVGSLVTVRDAIRKGSILEIQDGNHGEKHPKIEDFRGAGIPFITANCLNDGELELTNCYFLPHAWIKRLRVGFAVSGDVLLSHKGSIGFTAIVPSREEPVILSPQVTYYRPNPDSLLPQFLRAFFRTESFQVKMKREAKQTTRSYLGITRQLELPLFLPAMELQQMLTRRTASIESLRKIEDASLKELNVLFGSLQHRAFRGEL